VDGDEFVLKRDQFLYYLYEQGAVARDAPVDRGDVEAFLDVDEGEYDVLKSYLRDAGLVELREVWVRAVGGGTSSTREVWLTPKGVEEARRVVSAIRGEAGESSQRRIGFREPGEKEK